MSMSKYNRRLMRGMFIAAIAVVLCGLSIGFLSHHSILGDNATIKFAVFLAIYAGAVALTIPWWSSLDDVQKQGQLASWYWGSSAGGGMFLVWLIASNTHHTDFSQGAFYMLLTQGAVALIFYVFWRLRGRGHAE